MTAGGHRTRTWVFGHFVALLTVQAAYALAYVSSPYLRTAVVVPTLYRLVVWTLPVFLLLVRSKVNPLAYLKLRTNVRSGCVWGVCLGTAIVAANCLGRYILNGHCHLSFSLGLNLWIGPVILVGLSEEVVFRGYFLRQLAERTTFLGANLVQAVLFLGIHVPGWLLLHNFRFPGAVQQCVYVFGLALGLGYVLRRSNSLWSCMLIHSLSNFASFAVTA